MNISGLISSCFRYSYLPKEGFAGCNANLSKYLAIPVIFGITLYAAKCIYEHYRRKWTPIIFSDDQLIRRKEISKELFDYETVGIINVEEKQYAITNARSNYPVLSTHNLAPCFSIVCYDTAQKVASLSHFKCMEEMNYSWDKFQADLLNEYKLSGKNISKSLFRIYLVCGMTGFRDKSELEAAEHKIKSGIEGIGGKLVSIFRDITKDNIKSIAIDSRTGQVYNHTPVSWQKLCTGQEWAPSPKEVNFFENADKSRERLKEWINDKEHPSAVRSQPELQGIKNYKDKITIQINDLI